jgi:hypothetical protein
VAYGVGETSVKLGGMGSKINVVKLVDIVRYTNKNSNVNSK